MYVLLGGGVFGIFLVPFDLLYDPELLSHLSSGRLFSIVTVVFLYSALESALSLTAGIGIRLRKNWGRLLGGILLLLTPLSVALIVVTDSIEGDILFQVFALFTVLTALFVALGIAVLFFERSKQFFRVVSDTKLIETPPPPPEFD